MKIFNSSHMVPFDLPDVAHDMILRFMGMNFSAIVDGTALIPSKVGDDEKPVPVVLEGQDDSKSSLPGGTSKTPEQDKAMWEGKVPNIRSKFILADYELAYYNAGSAALVLVLIALAIGLFLFCRRRRTGRVVIGIPEESIPLSQNIAGVPMNGHEDDGDYKGKGRAHEGTAIFDVGSDDEGEYHDSRQK